MFFFLFFADKYIILYRYLSVYTSKHHWGPDASRTRALVITTFFFVATAADIPIYAHRSPLPASLMKKHVHVIPTFFRRQFVIDHFYPRFFHTIEHFSTFKIDGWIPYSVIFYRMFISWWHAIFGKLKNHGVDPLKLEELLMASILNPCSS